MKTKVLIIEDNPLIQSAYRRALATVAEIEIVGIASDGQAGFELLMKTDPDVILCDLNMPIMDGFEFTKKAMAEKPKPILIISDLVQKEDQENVFKALQLGAIDVLPKPRLAGDISLIGVELARKIKILKGVIVFRKVAEVAIPKQPEKPNEPQFTPPSPNTFDILAIGASTGGPQAYQVILESIPANFPIPVACVQHISAGFSQSLVDWLAHTSNGTVKFAEDGERPKAGFIYFPGDDKHLVLDSGIFRPSSAEVVRGHRPSVDVFFESLVKNKRLNTLAVLLTGMGDDGARGLKQIKDSGGYTIVQDEASSTVYGMPRVAAEMGAATEILSLEKIGPRIKSLVMGNV
jgi:two-component system chemotaxis response regulator CheB